MDPEGTEVSAAELRARRDSGSDGQDPAQEAPSNKKATAKKRTKTGCLTCRRRRIKCDEGKPRCNNCIKSKRQCDGYNQRVIFKDPMGPFRPSHLGPIVYQNTLDQPMLVDPHMSGAAGRSVGSASQGSLPFIAPRPSVVNDAPIHVPQNVHQHDIPYHPDQQQAFPLGPPQFPQPAPFLPPTQQPIDQSSVPFASLDVSGGFNVHQEATLPFAQAWPQQAAVDGVASSYMDPGLLSSTINTVSGEPAAWPVGEPVLNDPAALPAQYRHAEGNLVSDEDAYWYSDDDASLAESEDETNLEDEVNHLRSNDLGAIVAKRLHHRPPDAFGTQLRTVSNFADANVLATYVPSSTNSPLNDAQTAAVFWYFVNVTGPSMSLFERHPLDPSPIFQGQPVPRARQHIWTYTFPIIALNHPALLQAMLALGSLQMARLQGVPPTASMKHYHLCLRRIAKNYQSASRRVLPATLAATMLLAFYEVWNSDHDKWCKHMWGARAILKEIPYSAMTRKIVALKRRQRELLQDNNADPEKLQFANAIVAERDIDQVDTALLGQLTGQPVAYERDGNSNFNGSNSAPEPAPAWTAPDHYTEKDIETYELISDVFWWYCKMDVYQSILGGTPLLYGTYDHLMALLGRLCNFASHDQARKRKAKKPEAPSGSQGQSPPSFPGMMPSTGHVAIPAGFSPPRETTPEKNSSDELDPEAKIAAAVHEWESIRQTFDVFRAQLGFDFEPLGPEYEPPVSSPFGLALKYRTYSIACVWMNYYMGLIVLHRCHPSMPPIAMAAAGLAARQTTPYANEIGRIAAGLISEDLSPLTQASTLLSAVSIESSFPLFVAAVQYQDTAQRHWTVKWMHNIARLTGWQSARQIAAGCETGWVKAAQYGRGPPYEPPEDLEEVSTSVWVNPRRISDRIRELGDVEERLVLSSSERPHYAVGLLSMEADLERLELSDNT
ncbi:c6 zinc finger domain containing protein [Niveomyces insectorum RCEF 264]|uniref:C6 zinc finger domain containing protein n=1 Tax=Niveomyces insectorum RCEF 264 TaxID=1081102 RepID=A0A167SEN5_9HYPO|nr:c6 zinc finger domain containing protein [Niveomyces insectorum RCEF 264]